MMIEVRKPNGAEICEMKTCPIWEKEASRFPWRYDQKETCLIIEGSAEISTDDQTVTLQAGDFAVFPEGLECIWEIHKPLRKYYRFG